MGSLVWEADSFLVQHLVGQQCRLFSVLMDRKLPSWEGFWVIASCRAHHDLACSLPKGKAANWPGLFASVCAADLERGLKFQLEGNLLTSTELNKIKSNGVIEIGS